MQLVGMLDSPYVRRTAISLRLLGVPFEHRSISVFSTFEQFRAINPVVKAPTLVCDDGSVQVRAVPVRHRCEAYAYAVEEKTQQGRFDIEAAKALGIPEGPVYGRLKGGATVTLDDGRVIDGRTLVGPPRPGRRLVYSGDTTFAPDLIRLAEGADLLIHEATYTEAERPLADRAAHSTAAQAAEVARRAGVRRLMLTHFSPRYESEGSGLSELIEEARAIFPETEAAHDFLRVDVPRRDPV